MRLGKKKEKEKESESKSQVVEGINRLVCQAKTHHSLLKGESPSDVRPVWFVLIKALFVEQWWLMEWNGTMSSSSSCRPSGKRTSATSPSLFLLNPFCKQKNPQKQQHIHAHLRCFFLSFSPSCFRFFVSVSSFLPLALCCTFIPSRILFFSLWFHQTRFSSPSRLVSIPSHRPPLRRQRNYTGSLFKSAPSFRCVCVFRRD